VLCTTRLSTLGITSLVLNDIEQTPRGSGTNITFKALATLTSAAGDASDPARARPPQEENRGTAAAAAVHRRR
jgi:hypothetical protein